MAIAVINNNQSSISSKRCSDRNHGRRGMPTPLLVLLSSWKSMIPLLRTIFFLLCVYCTSHDDRRFSSLLSCCDAFSIIKTKTVLPHIHSYQPATTTRSIITTTTDSTTGMIRVLSTYTSILQIRPTAQLRSRSTTYVTTTTSSSSYVSVSNVDVISPNRLSSSMNTMKDMNTVIQYADAIVCGGGPTGLLSAIMLAQQQQQQQATTMVMSDGTNSTTTTTTTPRFPNIQVYDRLSPPITNPDDTTIWDTNVAKFYLIGLGGRGQLALNYFQLWYDVVLPRCISVIGRRDWTPSSPPEGVETIKPIRNNITTQVLPRDKLVSVLYQYIQQHYPDQITVHHNVEVQPIDFHYTNTSSHMNMNDDENNDDVDTSASSLSSSSLSSDLRHADTTALIRIAKCMSTTSVSTTKTATTSSTSDDDENDMDEANILCDTDVQYVSTPLLIAADGTVRTIANTISSFDLERIQHIPRYNFLQRIYAQQKAMFVKRYVDDNQRVYKTIPLKFPKDWRCDLNYSVRTKRFNLEALPANNKGDYCGVLLLRSTDPMAKANTDPNELRHLFDSMMPQFSRLIDNTTLAMVAKKPVSYLPTFRYVGPRLHEGSSTILLGDCAHTVKPYFGLGANSALEDVKILSEYLSKYNASIGQALYEYSKFRTIESKALVQISRELDRPGRLGFVTFILPIILDSIFHKMVPQLFMPNVITMLQRENYTFQQLARRKRLDRIAQLSIIGAGLTFVGTTVSTLVRIVSKYLQVRPVQVWTSFVLIAAVLSRLKSMDKSSTVEKS